MGFSQGLQFEVSNKATKIKAYHKTNNFIMTVSNLFEMEKLYFLVSQLVVAHLFPRNALENH